MRRAVPPPAPAPPPPKWHPNPTRWGLNLRVEGMMFGNNSKAAQDSGMGGLGVSLRYRPSPYFAFDLGVDVLSGTDFNGFQRTETPVSLERDALPQPAQPGAGLLPRRHELLARQGQLRLLLAALSSNNDGTFGAEYSYFGGQAGGGLEFRVSRHVALNIDVVGFMRKRTDDGRVPEYSDPDKGTTNSSGGALLRGGLTFWW